MKKSTIILNLLDDQSFKDWASSSYDTDHSFCQTDLFKQLDAQTLSAAKLFQSAASFNTTTIDLSSRTSILKNIHDSINENETIVDIVESKTNKSVFVYAKWMGIAASLAVLIMFLVSSPFNTDFNIKTDFAEVITQTLPDGSIVSLDANSELTSVGDWSGVNDRALKLTNDAFFSVTSNPKVGGSAFKVMTDIVDIEVLGTEFYVKTEGSSLRVIVKEGKVKVSPNNASNFESQILEAGDELIVSNDGQDIQTSTLTKNNIKDELAWRNGEIVFDNTSFIELKDIILDRFGYTVELSPALESSNRGISGVFPVNSVQLLTKSIATSLELQIDYKEDIISIGYIKKN